MFWKPSFLSNRVPTGSHKEAKGLGVNMTFAQMTAGRTIARTGAILRTQLWIWPIFGCLALFAIGFSVSSAVRETMKSSFQSQLQTLLNVEVSMIETWLKEQSVNADGEATRRQIREAIEQLIQRDAENSPSDSEKNEEEIRQQLAKDLRPAMTAHDFVGFAVVNREMKILASSNSELHGRALPEFEAFLTKALDGNTVVSTPFPSMAMLKDETGRFRSGVPTMFVCSPVRDNAFQVVGALAFRVRPEKEFTRILQLGRMGASGETYAFDKKGTMVSNSRFDEDLMLLGLIPDAEGAKSLLNLSVRNPGGNMLSGFRPKAHRSELPLTRMAAKAVAGEAGVDVEGYPDYRGVPVVGAWSWLPKYEMGIVTEVDYEEAFRPLWIVQWMFTGIYSLLGVSSVALFLFSLVVARLRREAQKTAIESKKLGQYVLEKKLGSGAMGVVYKGHHAMMRRPSAVKMLNVDLVNEASIQRFEREVQVTCQLNHPNTIAIYDYGRTPEGVFYYAMEYLSGIDLQQLVDSYGAQPEARVIKILTQICGSLYEAHSQGLVHRDIKPANIMLNRRGGEPDLVKVLDFGLVKALDEGKQAQASTSGLTGTPLYMSPEAIQFPMSVDSRSDIYAVGAVGYFLLTGQPVFPAQSLVELCQQHVSAVPEDPSTKLGKPVSSQLEDAIMACLEKNSANRPQTARDLAVAISKSPVANLWSINDADGWWGRHERGQLPTANSANQNGSEQTGTEQPTGPALGSGSRQQTVANYGRTYVGASDADE